MTTTADLARRHLDERLLPMRPLVGLARPHRGWIRALRDALGMSSTELATRMGTSQSVIPTIERNEVRGAIKLDTLERAADALGCDLVYALVPRTSLGEAVWSRAHERAAEHLEGVAHHMRLEDQAVSTADAGSQLDELTAWFIDRRGLWSEPPTNR